MVESCALLLDWRDSVLGLARDLVSLMRVEAGPFRVKIDGRQQLNGWKESIRQKRRRARAPYAHPEIVYGAPAQIQSANLLH